MKLVSFALFFLLFISPSYAELIVYNFTADWCVPCKSLKIDKKNDKEAQDLLHQYDGQLELNIDKFPILTNKWNITTLPQYVVVDFKELPDGTTKSTVLSRWTPADAAKGESSLNSLKNFLKKGLTLVLK